MNRRIERAFTLVELLVVIAIIGILIALLLPAVQAAREAARRKQCTNNLKQLGMACQNYASTKKHLPISKGYTGQNLNGKGWILDLLPYIESQAVCDQFKPYLDGNMSSGSGILHPNCREALRTPVSGLRCPTDETTGITSKNEFQITPNETIVTSYKGVAGTNLACRTTTNCDGLLWLSTFLRPIKFAMITDGTSHTMLIGEDIPSQNWHSAAYYANGDYCTTEYPLNSIYRPPQPENWPVVMTFRSLHPSGVQFCMADGSVQFIRETIKNTIYKALSTRAKGEADHSIQ
jgi:prepilin-type N-terminal cleavage/methylation domain-containing protein/prepilin-type processing-associated H-X9-DG protein